ncbi:acyl-CoA dehydrogenase family protein [Pseudonocardia eucalypti]|uniref:Acyl-CoA dehydrogenase family protein n=1 Tax=Pseudonocardia eucalypti TaxID=648755 RepID=A0ABP9PXE9_9PSEU|nr:alkylation response protein AidB-like acyl-CoA dehydrogenase [Pseudonocardia eucalypti]
MTTLAPGASTSRSYPATADEVLARVNELVPVLRDRAQATEKLRRMHPDTLEDLTSAGVCKLTMPKDAGGYEAEPRVLTEVLAQIARGCPSTSWIAAIIASANFWTGLLPDEAAEEILATPDLRMTSVFAPTTKAVAVDGGVLLSGQAQWNTGGVHSHWISLNAMQETEHGPFPIAVIIRADETTMHDTWHASGMAGTATNAFTVENVFVPQRRILSVLSLAEGTNFPQRKYSDHPYFNRPAVQFLSLVTAPPMLGMARGAMDVFMEKLPSKSITYTNYTKAAEAPLTHHQVAGAQFHLETAEMYMRAMEDLLNSTHGKEVSLESRIKTRAWCGQVAKHSRACVNQLFEASGASQIQHSAHIQRYFRDVNSLGLHALIQPTTSDELYGRMLCGLEPNTFFV